jgi:hypothetical protein
VKDRPPGGRQQTKEEPRHFRGGVLLCCDGVPCVQGRALIPLHRKEEIGMGWLIFLIVVVVVVAGILWGRKYFRREIERAKRINRANKKD